MAWPTPNSTLLCSLEDRYPNQISNSLPIILQLGPFKLPLMAFMAHNNSSYIVPNYKSPIHNGLVMCHHCNCLRKLKGFSNQYSLVPSSAPNPVRTGVTSHPSAILSRSISFLYKAKRRLLIVCRQPDPPSRSLPDHSDHYPNLKRQLKTNLSYNLGYQHRQWATLTKRLGTLQHYGKAKGQSQSMAKKPTSQIDSWA